MARRNGRPHVVPEADTALDAFKYEVADELGLLDKIRKRGWPEMTARECGKVGGRMVHRMVERAEEALAPEEKG